MYQRINQLTKSTVKKAASRFSFSKKFGGTQHLPAMIVTGKRVTDKRNPLFVLLHHAMLVLGVAAVTALSILFIKPHLATDLASEFQAISPFLKVNERAEMQAPPAVLALTTEISAQETENSPLSQPTAATQTTHTKQQQAVTNWLSKRYRVANGAATMLVSSAYSTAHDIKLDPLLILSVMAIESGLNPFAESAVGAQGLMQVMSKVHQDKFKNLGGIKAALDPAANIRVGAQILKEYVTRGGSVEAGLKLYVGAALSSNDGGYGNKVMAEYQRLKDVSNGKYVPVINTASTKPSVKTASAQATQISEHENITDNIKAEHPEPENVAAI